MKLATSNRPVVPTLDGLDPHDVEQAYTDRALDRLSDHAVFDLAARTVAEPRVTPADSFQLHAPLELMARLGLLGYVDPAARNRARKRMLWVALTLATSGTGVGSPAPITSADPLRDLLAAIDAGDLDAVDALAASCCDLVSPLELSRRLADPLVARLGAAAHGSIFLNWLPRFGSISNVVARLARPLLRDLARNPSWRLAWVDDDAVQTIAPGGDLLEALLAPPSPGDPGSTFIHPTMSLVDRGGLAAELLAAPTVGIDVAAARRDLLRVAAWSMLQDDPNHAPFGWTHCLSMPQATLGIAELCGDSRRAVRVAATYVLGFRSTLGKVELDPWWAPTRARHGDELSGLDGDPDEAAAAAWHAPRIRRPELLTRLATRAAVHHDAHLAKYTLACLDAARDDPDVAHQYLAAAAFLAAWWRAQPPAVDDPLP